MRSTLRTLVPLALVLAVAGCEDTSKDANERRVVILFTTDEHSQLFASWPELDDFIPGAAPGTLEGGAARRMTVLKQQRDAAAARGSSVATLTLSSGDFSQGSLASAAWLATSPELASMKLMGYDAVALGNHEFDLPPEALAQAISKATSLIDGTAQRPPLVLSNLNAAALAPLYGAGKPIAPRLVLTATNGLRIGVVASMGVGAGSVAGSAPPNAFWASTATTTTARFASVAAQVQAQVDALRAEGVDAVILLGHGGIGPDQLHPGEDELMALQLKGVDLVLSGHSHLFTPQARIVYGSGTAVPVVQAKPYGRNVGKVELVFRDDDEAPRPYLDPAGTQFFAVDEGVAKATDAAFLTDLNTRTIGFLEYGLDQNVATVIPSFLETTLTKITGTTVAAGAPGSLWTYTLGTALPGVGCTLGFEVEDASFGESNALNLDTDAIRAAGGELATTEIAVQAFGPLRGGLKPGTTGQIGFADVYHMAPLGGDPSVAPPTDMNPATNPVGVQAYLNAVPGYPLVRFNLPTVALRAVYETTLQFAYGVNGDFFLGASGLVVHYDPTRVPLFDPESPMGPGWVTYMALEGGAVLYDVTNTDWQAAGYFNPAEAAALRSVATTYYIAGFASAFGVTLYDDVGRPYGKAVDDCLPDPPGTCGAGPIENAILVRNEAHIKDYEAIARHIIDECAANGGTLPAEYGPTATVPRRVCLGACASP
ncbi:MAG TPA: metallophosphoesterase [Anaeromyxobacter sp.]|nr:metallophosphoesterase [Anaeromyxobacter sp.]